MSWAEFGREIGEGTFSSVFEAQFAGRRVAIKVVHRASIARHGQQERIRAEVLALRRCGDTHPNIAELLAVWEDAQNVYLVLRLVEGETLFSVLRGGAPKFSVVPRAVIAGLVHALEHLRRVGVVHRDLFPRNVVVQGLRGPPRDDEQEQSGIPVLVDFGYAACCGQPCIPLPRRAGETVAPEAEVGEANGLTAPAHPAEDLYALGCVLMIGCDDKDEAMRCRVELATLLSVSREDDHAFRTHWSQGS